MARNGTVMGIAQSAAVFSGTITFGGLILFNWYDRYMPIGSLIRERQEDADRQAEEVRLRHNQRCDEERRQEQARVSRAERLLKRYLTAEQRWTRRMHGYFDVQGQEHRYRIRRGSHGNVWQLDCRGRMIGNWCGQPNHVPEPDMHLAQLLLIRHDERGFRKRANFSRGGPY